MNNTKDIQYNEFLLVDDDDVFITLNSIDFNDWIASAL